MDFSAVLSESVTYSREALMGKWRRWATFIVFALPASLIQFIINPKTIVASTGGINWSALPWGQIAILFGVGFLLSFFITGYIVRVYQGVKPAPDFTGWTNLFIDGIKLDIIWILWFMPGMVITVLAGAEFLVSFTDTSGSNLSFLLLLSLLLIVGSILIIIALLFGILGVIRFARTNSIREGISFSNILTQIRTIGWGTYIIALVLFAVAAAIYFVVVMVITFIPYIGWILILVVNPFFTIFVARYFTLVYEQGNKHQVPPLPVV